MPDGDLFFISWLVAPDMGLEFTQSEGLVTHA